jgi:hemerythrin superfamily protein
MPSATQLIRQDHKRVEALFKKFDQSKAGTAKRRVAENAMTELEVHAALEEEIFYPAIEKELDDRSMVKEARDEHKTVKELIAELKSLGNEEDEGEEFETKFNEMMQNVRHHVEEEENEMLPKVEETELDLRNLGDQMAKRKQALQKGGGAKKKRTSSTSRSKTTTRSKTKSKTKAKSKSKSKRKRSA